MKILGQTIENYGSFEGRHEIALADRGAVFVCGENLDEPKMESNGAGKSTVFDAVDWAFFGKVPKKDQADSVVNEREGKGCCVTVRLLDGEIPVTVQRFRKMASKNGVRLWEGVHVADFDDGNNAAHRPYELTTLDSKETQKLIEQVLGLDRDVFHAAVYRSQFDDFNFAAAGDAKRKEILTRILQLGEIDAWLERAKEELGKQQVKMGQWQLQAAQLQTELDMLSAENVDAQIAEWERQREVRLADLRERWGQVKQGFDAAQTHYAQVPALKAEYEKLDALARGMPQPTDGREQLDELTRELGARNAELKAAQAEGYRQSQRALAIRNKGTGVCSECGQQITGDHVMREAQKFDALAEQQAQIAASAQARVRELEGLVHGARQAMELGQGAHLQQMAELNRQVGEAKRLYMDAQQAGHEVARLQRMLDDIQNQGQAGKAEVNPYLQRKQWVEARKAEITLQLGTVNTELYNAAPRFQALEYWVRGFGREGLKSYVLDARLEEMNAAANEWVRVLSGGTIWVRFESQTATQTGKLSERLNVRCWRYNPDGTITERNYESWSGGEKARLDLGIDFGLARLVAARATKRYEMIVLDEVFRHLDAAGRDAVMELLQLIAQEKSSIFVIDHDAEFRGAFEHLMLVRKQNGRSVIVS